MNINGHAYIFQIDAIDFEVTDLDDLDPSHFLSDGEEDVDLKTDYGVLTELDFFGRVNQNKNKKPSDIQKVQLALKLQQRARELDLKANSLLSSVVQTSPSVTHFAFLLGQVSRPQPSQSVTPAVNNENHPRLTDPNAPNLMIPRKSTVNGKVRFSCRICNFQRGSWSGCDSHIRKSHSFMKYGPCRKCDMFTTFNADSFRSHLNACQS